MLKMLKSMSKNILLNVVILLGAGIVLIAVPQSSKVLFRALGFITAAGGIVQSVHNLNPKKKLTADTTMDTAAGFVMIVLGFMILFKPEPFMDIAEYLISIIIMIFGMYILAQSITLKRYGYPRWWLALILAIVNIVVSVSQYVHPLPTIEGMIRLMGVMLIYNAAATVITMFTVGRTDEKK
ncbi:MAG: DUF308 domain-containing protein [Lachnospiraceae bacterium]|jgi:uncharacterized membrane protein HdeD (DUF308 family)